MDSGHKRITLRLGTGFSQKRTKETKGGSGSEVKLPRKLQAEGMPQRMESFNLSTYQPFKRNNLSTASDSGDSFVIPPSSPCHVRRHNDSRDSGVSRCRVTLPRAGQALFFALTAFYSSSCAALQDFIHHAPFLPTQNPWSGKWAIAYGIAARMAPATGSALRLSWRWDFAASRLSI